MTAPANLPSNVVRLPVRPPPLPPESPELVILACILCSLPKKARRQAAAEIALCAQREPDSEVYAKAHNFVRLLTAGGHV